MKVEMEAQAKDQQEFMHHLSTSLQIFDPRDRDLPKDDNQAVKRDELYQLIQDL